MRPVRLAIVCVLSIAIFATPASAYWSTSGTGSGSGIVVTMPAGLQPTATSNGQNVTVTWPQSSFGGSPLGTYAGGGYKLTRYAAGGSAPVTPNASCATRISGAGATLQCIETGVSYGTWHYAVTPVLNSLTGPESANSTATSVVTIAPTLATVAAQNPAAGQTTGDIQLTWIAASGATGYNIYRRTAAGSFNFASPLNGAIPLAGTTYPDPGSGLATASTYFYVIRAVAGSPVVESASSNAMSAATISRPAAPVSVTATAVPAAHIDVAWAGVSGAVGYNVYRTSTGTYDFGTPLNGGSLVATTAYADTTAVNAVTYRYIVRAVILGAGGARVESANSSESGAVVADGAAPDAPGAPTVTNGHVLPAGRCNIAAGTRFVNYASKAAVTVATTLASPEAGATVVFTATTPARPPSSAPRQPPQRPRRRSTSRRWPTASSRSRRTRAMPPATSRQRRP